MPRDTIRHNWDAKLRRVLEEKGFDTGPFSHRYSSFEERKDPVHPSALIRTLTKHSLMSYEARTVFYVSYFGLRSEITEINLEFPDRRDFEEQLRREEASASDIDEAQEPSTEAGEESNEG